MPHDDGGTPLVIPIVESCVAGTDPCNDTGGGLAVPAWFDFIGLVPVVVVIAFVLWFAIRSRRG